MPKFLYKAKKGPSQTVEGELYAENEAAAIARIERMGCCAVSISEGSGPDLPASGRVRAGSRREVTVFTRQMASLLKSGVPILRALRTVREQSSGGFRVLLKEIEDRVRDGRMLSEAMADHPEAFSELYLNMARAGESAGILDRILLRLADAREREDEVRGKVRAALAYPALVLGVGLLTVVLMMTVFLPRIAGFYKSYGDLPAATRALMALSNGVTDHWLWIVAPAILIVGVYLRVSSGGKGKEFADAAKLKLPLAGRLILESEIARFCRTLSLLIESGIPVERALALAAATFANSALRLEVDAVRKGTVEHGMSVAAGLADSRHFPVFARNMAAVGEESGRLDESLADVARYYEKEVERKVAVAVTLLEPALILAVGGIVGLIAVAMMLPIFTISRSFM